MKVQELVKVINDSKNKMLKTEQLQMVLKKTLEIKEYLSIKEKKMLVDDIVNECILYENGVFKFDEIEKYICFTMKTIGAYTNLEFSKDIEDDYDILCREGLLEIIIALFKKEYDEISILLQMKSDFILSENSIESQVGRFLDELLEKIDDVAKTVTNMIENFDISNLPINKDDIGKLLEFMNIQK